LKTKALLFCLGAIAFALLFLGNLMLATRLVPRSETSRWPWAIVRQLQPIIKTSVILGTALLSLIFGLIAQGNWQEILRYFNGQPFGITDPAFHREVSFYVFSLPFLNLLRSWLTGALIITLLGSGAIYFLGYSVQQGLRLHLSQKVLAHLGGLMIAILGLFAWGYWLGIWELVFSPQGVVFGAGYADIHAKLPAQWMLLGVVIILIGFIVFSILKHKYKWPLYGLAGWLVAAIIIGGIFPTVVQRLQVQPNELVREKPYIEYNIAFTRQAYGLEVDEQSFPAEEMPNIEDLAQNQSTIDNIRLWDHRPLKDTYNQIQSIRLYYDFNDVDVDRYTIDGQYRQVMLSARELSAEKLSGQAQTWVNRRLQFTHGYGIVMSPVNEIGAQGLPVLLVKDIPPTGKLAIEQPQIYFGEKTNEYVIVRTTTQEFDFPMGDENAYNQWEGERGVSVGGFFNRLIYAWQFGDFNIMLSDELIPESQILYYRNIQQRVNHLAPFLKLDNDPYLVVMDGKLLWIQDAYTTSDRYPYSEPLGNGLNYIRNSVKVVIDAYDGQVTFYITDPQDPLIQTYQQIYPELFVSGEEMPEALRAHLRYPEDLFNIQASIYQSYHMSDARVFYNKEDLWAVPREVYADQEQPLEPYYVIMRLPDSSQEEFLLMLPFTPVNKNNTIGWLAARCDGDNYGKLLAYFFPKDSLVYGPSQIENRIQQDTVITEQLALWSRGGSRVIRGNLLMIPVGESKIYVEPVFLQAEAGGLPELKRVIVAAGEQIAMEPTLAESLAAIFGAAQALPSEPVTGPPSDIEPESPVPTNLSSLVLEAQEHYQRAQQFLKDGDWAGYGREIAALETTLEQLSEASK
jgi:hypothetical protein